MTHSIWADAQIISRYTRAQALTDGVLIEVSRAVSIEAGFRWPVALTAGAWADAVAWDERAEKAKPSGQSEAGRLWDVLFMARQALRRAPFGEQRVAFQVLRLPATGSEMHPLPVTLHVSPSLGDDGEPVLTFMLPDED